MAININELGTYIYVASTTEPDMTGKFKCIVCGDIHPLPEVIFNRANNGVNTCTWCACNRLRGQQPHQH